MFVMVPIYCILGTFFDPHPNMAVLFADQPMCFPCWYSVGNDLSGVGNEPEGDSLKGSHNSLIPCPEPSQQDTNKALEFTKETCSLFGTLCLGDSTAMGLDF